MSAGNWQCVNNFTLETFEKLINLATDTLKVALVTSASNIAVAMSPATYAALTNELATSGGYTAGGATAATPALTGGGATATIAFSTADVTWTGSGGGFAARFAVLYSDTSASKLIIAFCLLDSAPANVTITAGQLLRIQLPNVFNAIAS